MKKDNAGILSKKTLRRRALEFMQDTPVILEPYAGEGALFEELYTDAEFGVAIDKDEAKTKLLVEQRPAWRVYQCDSVEAVRHGLAADVPFNYLDADPYRDPWPVIMAFLRRPRARADRLVLAVNDGLRRGLKMGTAWKVRTVRPALVKFGAEVIRDDYISVCRWLMERHALHAGYEIAEFEGFHAGHAQQMTHYYAVLNRKA